MEEPGSAKNLAAQLLNIWEIPGAVLLSFTAHLFMMILSSTRRRKSTGGRMLILWGAYQLANWVAPYALNNISPSGKTMSRREELLAFWATFLLHNLGGPDNMSAFSLEDNTLYRREAILVLSRVGGASYVLYKHLHPSSGGGNLIPASIIVFAVGVAKYAERVRALWQGDLGNIRGSGEKGPSRSSTTCASAGLASGSLIRKGMFSRLDDEEALMVAHDMLRFSTRAMADSSVVEAEDHLDHRESREIFSLTVENMCKVVEMELSLTYDILYTNAAVIQTRLGYGIRVASPLAIAAATVLFVFHSKEGQSKPDVIITYTLLLATFLLDMRWLLRALGSTWAHAFLQSSRLKHAVLCTGRWHRLRSVVVSLDIGRLRLTAHPVSPSSYRRWSGTVGPYNLLSMCTQKISRFGNVVKAIGLEDIWNEFKHSEGHTLSQEVKNLVFKRVQKILKSTYEKDEEEDEDGRYSMRKLTTFWGQVAIRSRPQELRTISLAIAGEFQEDILAWHIATQVFLASTDQSWLALAMPHAKAIKVLSEYLMFLGTVRQHMLPGLVLRGLYEVTKQSLEKVWEDNTDTISSSRTSSEKKLAHTLLNIKHEDSEWGFDDRETLLLSDAVNIAIELHQAEESQMRQLLELVFNVWVDKLLYAAARGRPESHAKQLCCGGDLVTIVMIMVQHAGSFKMSERHDM